MITVLWAAPLLVMVLAADPVGARTLVVGPSHPLSVPSAAARIAQDGDTVLVEPGAYYDCAVWAQDHLSIAGSGDGVVITDTTCQGKALFVVTGDEAIIRDLTLARARVPDGNGAGIRLEGQGLTLERVRFENNQVGLLAGVTGRGEIHITDCAFTGGGAGGSHPRFAVTVGEVGLLRVRSSTFDAVAGGQIRSDAERTELFANRIGSGSGEAPAVAVLAAGDHLTMTDNILSIGPNLPYPAAAVLATGHNPPQLQRNRLQNTSGAPAALLVDWSSAAAVLEDNHVQPGDTMRTSRGRWRHRAATTYHEVRSSARAYAGHIKGHIKRWLAP